MSIGYAVSDDLSISYTQEESSRNMLTSSTATYDIDMESVQLAYSLGGATLSVARSLLNDNVGYADGVDAKDTIVSLSIAF